VRDSRGREWVAKVGKEAQSETAAVRLVWAAGYVSEINYLVPRVNIPGKGVFQNVRFEARPKNVKRLDEWSWKQNPFSGTRELEGLKVLMVMVNNWDLKDENNVVLYAPGGGRVGAELRYVVSDLGATFGKTGGGPGSGAHAQPQRARGLRRLEVHRQGRGRLRRLPLHGQEQGSR
jgi:hypothetical protein